MPRPDSSLLSEGLWTTSRRGPGRFPPSLSLREGECLRSFLEDPAVEDRSATFQSDRSRGFSRQVKTAASPHRLPPIFSSLSSGSSKSRS